MERARTNRTLHALFRAVPVVFLIGCQDEPPEPPPCDDACTDGIALRSLRETMKLVYNITLQGNPEGAQDESTPCPLGGSARIFGTATANPVHGATEVELTYELDDCRYVEIDDEPVETYAMMVDGVVTQSGVLAVQPTATTALLFQSDSVTLTGSVFDPPRPFLEEDCVLDVVQNGNDLSGLLCEREVGVDLGGPQN
ncbi:MAG TPA: hypothetical protein VFZ53_18055 [Polyangiaceae bacterium]